MRLKGKGRGWEEHRSRSDLERYREGKVVYALALSTRIFFDVDESHVFDRESARKKNGRSDEYVSEGTRELTDERKVCA